MKKVFARRSLSSILAILVVVTTVFGGFPGSLVTTKADAATTQFALMWDGEVVEDHAITIYYGDAVSWELQDYTGNDEPGFAYISTDVGNDNLENEDWENWGNYVTLNPGTYYLGYESEGETILDDTYTVTVEKGTIGQPLNVAWDSATPTLATWSKPVTTSSGGELAQNAISGYMLTLYCDGEQVGNTISCGNNTFDYEFTNTIDDNGYGEYTFTVYAQVNSIYADYYQNSEVASSQEAYDYHDTTDPIVQGIAVSDDGTKMIGTALDEHTGIYAYAFTTKSDASNLTQEDWTQVTDAVEANVTEEIEYMPEEEGQYYFYVKDQAGNIARSDESMAVTKLVYHNAIYTNGEAADETQLVITNSAITQLQGGVRKGYVLSGWKDNEQLTGDDVTTVEVEDLGSCVNLYAEWTEQTIDVTVESDAQETEKTYDGEPITLSANIAQLEAGTLEADSISYQWYRKTTGEYEAIEGATESEYAVTDVSQSGSYIVQVSISIAGEEEQSGTSQSPVMVTINKAPLTITADAKSITYGEETPEFTYSYEGFVQDETAQEVLTVGEASCDYEKGFDAGSYDITIDDNSGFVADNYALTYVGSTLTVNPKQVEDDGAGVIAALTIPEDGYTYALDGGVPVSYEPEVTVTDNSISDDEVTLDAGADYEVSYSNNNKAGEATVTITFQNNYAGTITKTFEIAKNTFTTQVSIQNWKYGDYTEECGPTVNQLGENTLTDVTYQYRMAAQADDDTAWTTKRPTDAGDYQVRAIVPATANYETVISEAVDFTIEKRLLVLSSQSGSWIYTGATRTLPEVTIEDSYTNDNQEEVLADGLATEDDFKTYSATGSIQSVGVVENTISYEFTSTTNPDNYEVVLLPGTLEVTQAVLSAPDYAGWSTTSPAMASWNAVTRTGLQVQYNLRLYREGGDVDVQIGDVYSTTSTYYDFADVIHEDAQAAGYYYTVEVEPIGGENVANYLTGLSGVSTYIYTAKVTVTGDGGVDTVSIREATGHTAYAYLIEGEKAELDVTYARGYTAVDTIWSVAAGSEDALTIADATAQTTTVTLGDLDAANDDLQITAGSDSTGAQGTIAFSSYGENGQSVEYTLTITDEKGIGGYYLATEMDENLTVDAQGWITPQSGEAVDNGSFVTYTKTITFDEAGTYYIAVKDDDDNLTWMTDTIKIYSIAFDANGGSGEQMESVLKAQDQDITLPANTYTYEGKGFAKWLGTNGTYTNQGTYDDNTNDTLYAQWSDETYELNVNYYYMDTQGEYAQSPDETTTISATYASTIRATDVQLAKNMTGMSLDTDATLSCVTINGNGQTYNIYYKRAQYTLSYSYVQAGTSDTTIALGEYQYYYGQTIDTEETKPTADGYDFVGWVYGSTGDKPETMPNQNLAATGSFVAQSAYYKVNYYVMNLEGTAYTLLTEATDTNVSSHDEVLDFTVEEAKAIAGYTAQKVKVTYGAAGTADDTGASSDGVSGTVSAIQPQEGNEEAFTGTDGTLQVNYYYSRNSYTLTLNIWRGDHNTASNRIYKAYWTFQYGEDLVGEDADHPNTTAMADYFTNHVYGSSQATITSPTVVTEFDAENINLESYTLADYTDWSTGTAPTTMPAGNVSVTRDYIQANKVAYQVYVYQANKDNTYNADPTKITYYGNVGEQITIGQEDADVLYSSLATIIDSNLLDNYEYDADTTNGQDAFVLTSTATDNILKIYFKRKTVTATINYYVKDESGDHLLKTETKSGIWGNYYDPEPMMYFTDYYIDENYNLIAADGNQNFRDQEYVVSYSGYALRNGNHYYPNYKFTSSSQWVDPTSSDYYLTSATKESRAGYYSVYKYGSTERSRYINVYYTKAGEPLSLDVKYKDPITNSTDALTVTYEGNDYPVRLINKRLAVPYTIDEGSSDVLYPGGSIYQNEYIYDDTSVNENYTNVTSEIRALEAENGTASSCEYYLWDSDGDGTDDYLCMVPSQDAGENFIKGSRIGYSMSSDANSIAHVKANSLKAALNEEYNGMYEWNNYSQSGVFYADTTLTYTLKVKDAHYMYYYLDGQYIGASSSYYTGTRTKDAVVTEGTSFAEAKGLVKDGYTIEWYEDAGFTKALSDSYNMSTNHSLYGKSVKDKKLYHKYIHYELSDNLTYDSQSLNYITATQLEEMTQASENEFVLEDTSGNSYTFTREQTAGDEVTISDGLGGSYTYTPVVYKYYYKDELVLIDENHYSYTYSAISLSYADYGKSNYHFEDTNTSNVLNGYCETSIFDLSAYYARDTYNVLVNTNNTSSSVWKQYTYKVGETVTLTQPTKDGYNFNGWTWRTYTTASNGTITLGDDLSEDMNALATQVEDGIAIQMPTQNISVQANWVPGPYDQTITHYYQTTDFSYESARLASIQEIMSASTQEELEAMSKWINIDGELVSGYVVTSEETVLGLVVTEENVTQYYLSKSVNDAGTIYNTTQSRLFAVVSVQELESETSYEYGAYSRAVEDKYAFANAVYRYGKEIVSTTDETQTFTAAIDTKLDYYYTRDTAYSLNLAVKSLDAGEASATLAGAGNGYTYGQDVSVGAIVATGYTFVGWYEAEDVLADYTVGDDITQKSLIEDLSGVEPVTTESTLSYPIEEKSSNLVAVVSADGVAQATITITSDVTSYDYGYTSQDVKNLKANVAMTDASATTYIKAYQWYQVDGEERTPIEGATSAAYPFETGKDAGTYTYNCDVTIARSDNGREVTYTATAPLTITVNKIDLEVEATAYQGLYDASAHGITVDVTLPEQYENLTNENGGYAIYYSDATELNSTNYETAGTTNVEEIKKTNVRDEAGSAYTIYYYVKPLDESLSNNYNAVAGSSTIAINPRELTLTPTDEVFEMSYTGSTVVAGDVLTEGTDKYQLSHGGYYTVSGWYQDEQVDESQDYEVDFTAQYNSAHVSKAGSISITDIIAIYKDGAHAGERNYNYVVQSGSILNLTATIAKRTIEVTWQIADDDANGTMSSDSEGVQTASYDYTGTRHMPQAVFTNLDQELQDLLTLTVNGGQIAAGSYTATASLSSTDEDLDIGDFELSQATCAYTISFVEVFIKPMTQTVTYDGEEHTLTTYGLYMANESSELDYLMNGIDEDGNPTHDEAEAVSYSNTVTIAGKTYTFTAETIGTDATDGRYVDAGTYELKATLAQFKDSEGKVVTDNFIVSYGQDTLTIAPAEIIVEGITANDKVYDNTQDATLDCSQVTFSGQVSTDELSINTDLITGTFDSASVGTDKEVTIVIQNGALTGSDKDNYVLHLTDGDTQVTTTQADIAKAMLIIAPTAVDTTYGESVQLGAQIAVSSGLLGNDTEQQVGVSGSLKFIATSTSDGAVYQYNYELDENATLSTLAELDAVSYANLALPAGEYNITLDTSNLTVSDYDVVSYVLNEEVQVMASKLLTIAKRPVAIEAVNAVQLEKDYDGTTDITSEQEMLLARQSTLTDSVYGNQYVKFTKVDAQEASGVIAQDYNTFGFAQTSPFTATYSSKNVNTEKNAVGSSENPITLTSITLNNANYELTTESIELTAKINPIALTLTADDKSTTYGTTVTSGDETVPGYDTSNCSVTQEGLLSGETLETALNSEVTYSTTYVNGTGSDASAQGTYPNVGTYTIAIEENSAQYNNYEITYHTGTLTVEQAVITVKMLQDVDMIYGETVDHDFFDVTYSGFVFDDTESVISSADTINYSFTYTDTSGNPVNVTLTPSGDTKTHTSPDHAGRYSVTPSNDNWSALNYSFRVSSASADRKYLIVGKKSITIGANGNLVVDDKVYDGTKAVSLDQIKYYTNAQLAKIENGEDPGEPLSYDATYGFFTDSAGDSVLLDADIDYLRDNEITGITFDLSTASTFYAQKDVLVNNGEIADIQVTLSYSLIDYLDQKYEIVLNDSQQLAYSKITRKDLTIRAVATPEEIFYGDDIPTYSNTYTGFVSGESIATNHILETETDTLEANSVQGSYGEIWNCEYTADSDNSFGGVTSYTLTPSGFVEGANRNYNVSYESTTFEVCQATFAAPQPNFSEAEPGTVTFEALEDIGDVSVTSYSMNLYYKANDAQDYETIDISGSDEDETDAYVITADESESYTKDLKEIMRQNGPGAYYVDVTAEAGTENNVNYINVKQYSQVGLSDVIYVANVTLTFDCSAESESNTNDTLAAIAQAQKDSPDGTMSLSLNGSAQEVTTSDTVSTLSMNVIEGESAIPFTMNLTDKIASGYDVLSVSSEEAAVAVADNPTNAYTMKTTDEQDQVIPANRDYAGSFGLTTALTSGADITIHVKLKAVVYDITAVHLVGRQSNLGVTPYSTSAEIQYGYSYADSPYFTTQVATVDGDTITTDDYTFTYEWKYRKSSTSSYVTMGDVTEGTTDTINTIQFPMNQSYSANYQIYCEITATRKDNGRTAAVFSTKDLKNANGKSVGPLKVKVNRGDFSARAVLNGWTYGETRNTPYLTEIADTTNTEMTTYPGEDVSLPAGITYTYYQKLTADEYEALTQQEQESCVLVSSDYYLQLEGQPTEGGTWYVQSYIPNSENYAEFTTDFTEFTILPTQLSVPEDLEAPTPGSENGNEIYKFGDVIWSPVSGVLENAGVNSASEVTVTYAITLQYHDDSSSTWEDVMTSEQAEQFASIEGTSCNLAEYMTENGAYKITVKAVSSNKADALDSEESDSIIVHVDGEVLVNGGVVDATEVEKTYDEVAINLSADFGSNITESDNATYQWYLDDTLVGTGEEWCVTDVNESGYYHCVATKQDGVQLYTTRKLITIHPRQIEVTASDASRTYQGTALTYPEATITSETGLANENDTIAYTFTEDSTITNVGTATNAIAQVSITKADGQEDTLTLNPQDASQVTTNYIVTTTNGTLTVTKQTLTIKAADRVIDYGQDAEVDSENADSWVTYGDALNDADGFVNNETVANLTLAENLSGITYSYEDYVAGSSAGTYTITPYGYSSSNYDIHYVTGTLTVQPIDNTLTFQAADMIYDGAAYDEADDRLVLTKNGDGAVSYTYYEEITQQEYEALDETAKQEVRSVTLEQGTQYYRPLETAPTNAGSYGVVGEVAFDGNYNAAQTEFVTFTIAKRALTFTPVDFSVVQGTELTQGEKYVDEAGYTVDGFAEGEDESNLTLDEGLTGMDYRYVVDAQTPTYYTTQTPYGIYTIVIGGYSSDNYTITYNTGTLTVTGESDTSVALTAHSITYDGKAYDMADDMTTRLELTTAQNNSGVVSYDYYEKITAQEYEALEETQKETVELLDDTYYQPLTQAPTGIGQYAVKARIASDGHYFATQTNLAEFTINKATLVITANDTTIHFEDAPANAGVEYVGLVNGETADVLEGELSYTYTDENQVAYEAGNTQTGKAGTYVITPSGYTAANYNIEYVAGTMTVEKITDAYTFTAANMTYTAQAYDATTQLELITNSTGEVSYTYYEVIAQEEYDALDEEAGEAVVIVDSEQGTTYYRMLEEAPTNAGNYAVTATIQEDANYVQMVSGLTPFTIAKAPLTITAVDCVIAFDSQPANEGVTYDGFVGGEGEEVLEGTLVYSYTYEAGDPRGDYEINVSGYSAANYEITYQQGILTVGEAANTIDLSAEDAVYTGAAYDEETNIALSYRGNGTATYQYYREVSENEYNALEDSNRLSITTTADEMQTTAYYELLDEAPVSVGSYALTVTTEAYEQYLETTSSPVTFAITKAVLNVKAEDAQIGYGDEPANAGVSYEGFVNGETEADLGGTLSYAYSYVVGDDAGEYVITPSGYSSPNYDIHYETGTLTVETIDDTLTLQAEDVIYDGTAYDTADDMSTRLVLTKNGDGAATYTYYEEQSQEEYEALDETAKQEIKTVTSAQETKYYQRLDTAPTNAGSYGVVAQVAASGNYNETQSELAAFAITKAPLTITANAVEIDYYQGAEGSGVTFSGFVNGETQEILSGSVAYTFTYVDGNNEIQTYEIGDPVGNHYVVTPYGYMSDNYEITYVPAVMTVNKAQNDLTLVAPDATYDGAAYNDATLTQSALSTGDVTYQYSQKTGEDTYTPIDGAPTAPGTYRVVATVAGDDNCYEAISEVKTFTISKANLVIRANDNAIVYGDEPANAGVSYEGFVNNETEADLGGTLSYAYSYTAGDNAGEYAITPSGQTSDNYEITFMPGTLTVQKAANSVTLTVEPSVNYDGNPYDSDSDRLQVDKSGDGEVTFLYYGCDLDEDGQPYEQLETAPTQPGSYWVKARVSADTNYAAGESEWEEFEIRPCVTFDVNDDDLVEANMDTTSIYVDYNSNLNEVTKPEPTRENYEFLGWYTQEDEPIDDMMVTQNITVYAKWRETVAPNGTIIVNSYDIWNTVLDNITFGLRYATSKTATITAADDGFMVTQENETIQTNVVNSGMKEIYYHVESAASSTDVTTYTANDLKDKGDDFWSNYTEPVELAFGAYYVVYAKLVDNAGNASYLSTNGLDIHEENLTNETLYNPQTTQTQEDGTSTNESGAGWLKTQVDIEEASSNAVVQKTKQNEEEEDTTFEVAKDFGLESAVITLDNEEIFLSESDEATLSLRIQDVDEEDTSYQSDKNKVESYVNNSAQSEKIGAYVDISLYLTRNGVESKLVDTQSNDVTITLAIPETLQGHDSYDVVRVHGGIATVLDNETTNDSITFTTNQFSTYAIVYTDKTEESSDSGSGSSSKNKDKEYLEKTNRSGVSGQDVVDALGVDPETASKILDIMDKYDVSLDTIKITEEALMNQKNDSDLKGSTFSRLKARAIKCKKKSMVIKWVKQSGADGYQIYGNYCNKGGKIYKKKLIKTVSKNTTSLKLKKLKTGRYYKFVVRAYKVVNGKKVTLASSCTIHSTTTGGKYGVAKSVKITKVGKKKSTKITLKKGKTAKIRAKEVRQIKSKRIQKHRVISYEVSNKKVAKVTKSGKIKAKKKGTCKIWVYAQNGVYKTIKLTVK
ncbi:MBG domain-containing protein [Eubacterium oxidoreducens]|uniref:Listeria/Bacterioides repeat-containing protein n=1 Tax=Eubacterium oxidoreducens TaxID=1732 RepID=A0A1G6A6D7_EUBOX|nr:MBG domain-containing protein [Eubacterium oxidoreducens]SDB03974.1 Listeria/Bacterioides repeat-containing protein [Eubacterium oxidoreducens]